jgi:hypothetical protein
MSHLLEQKVRQIQEKRAELKGNVAGEAVMLEPRNQTSVRFKFGAMVKVA